MESVTLLILGSLAYHAFLFYYFDNLISYESRALTLFRLWAYFLVGYVFNLALTVFAWKLAEETGLSSNIISLTEYYFVINLVVTMIMLIFTIRFSFKKETKGAIASKLKRKWDY